MQKKRSRAKRPRLQRAVIRDQSHLKLSGSAAETFWLKTLENLVPSRRRATVDVQFIEKNVDQVFRDLRHLWMDYNEEENRDRKDRGDVATLKRSIAYVLGFHLNNQSRAEMFLERFFLLSPQVKERLNELPLRLLDLGCGSAAASAAWVNALDASSKIEVDLIDRSRVLLHAARETFKSIYPDLPVKTLGASLKDARVFELLSRMIHAPKRADEVLIINLSFVWNEISKPIRRNMKDIWIAALKAKRPVLLYLAEPAREHESRELLALRNELVSSGYQVLAPCPHNQLCPMTGTNNWCYSEVDNHQVDFWQPVARALRLRRERLGVTALLLASPKALDCLKAQTTVKKVLVGRPLDARGEAQMLLCTDSGLVKERLRSQYILRGDEV